jgi:outer membrane receptor protein involved in Fe transport
MPPKYCLFRYLTLFCFTIACCVNALHAQNTTRGIVTDGSNGEALTGVSVSAGRYGVITDPGGNFVIRIPLADSVLLTFSYTGYESQRLYVTATDTFLYIKLQVVSNQLSEAVVTSGRNATELKRQTVSVDVIKPYLVENRITTNLEHLMNQLPSVNVIDGQVNIRSGSGWTYGAGSRVQILVDDVPLLTGDAGQVQWKFIPTDNIGSIEVMKGAGSVMYGSSALNGIINIRTATPTTKGKFSANVFTGMYSKPQRDSARWWKGTQYYSGVNTFYSKRYNRTDFTIGLNALNDNGYRLGEYDKRVRINTKTDYRFKRITGLAAGINASVMKQQSASFLLWESYAYGYTSLDSAQTQTNATVISIDPHADWVFPRTKLRYRGRYYSVNNNIEESTPGVDQDNSSLNAYNELTAHYFLSRNLGTLAVGTSHNYTLSQSPLYGNRDQSATNYAFFIQSDLQWKKWTLNAGLRYEHFTMNTHRNEQLIGRLGLGYEVHKYTFLRASAGQGYRYPTIAERYIETSVGLVNIFPNPDLEPEKGYSAEAGIRQGFMLGELKGFIDIAGFYTEYNNMIEFNFGQWRNRTYTTPPPGPVDLRNIGFKSFNIGRASVAGIDVGVSSAYKTGKTELMIVAGYTFTKPVMLEPGKVFATDSSASRRPYTYNYTSTDTAGHLLKYRYEHLARFDVQLTYNKQWMMGVSLRYNSYMQNADTVFTTPIFNAVAPGISRGRSLNPGGDFLADVRIGYTIRRFTITLTVNNIFNREVMTRPADLRPTRLSILQLGYKF